MNYQKIYNQLINRAQNRIIEGYSERHHIIPTCIGGTNKKDNIVRLTPEEHYVAHQMLIKIYPGVKGLVYAILRMAGKGPYGKRNNKLYGWLRREYGKTASNNLKGKPHSAEHNKKVSEALKGRKLSPEHAAKCKNGRLGKTPWNKGIPMSDETKKKVSDSTKGRTHIFTKEHKDAVSKAKKGKPWTDKQREVHMAERAARKKK